MQIHLLQDNHHQANIWLYQQITVHCRHYVVETNVVCGASRESNLTCLATAGICHNLARRRLPAYLRNKDACSTIIFITNTLSAARICSVLTSSVPETSFLVRHKRCDSAQQGPNAKEIKKPADIRCCTHLTLPHSGCTDKNSAPNRTYIAHI